MQRSRTRYPWRTSHTDPGRYLDDGRRSMVPRGARLAWLASLVLAAGLLASCSVLVESEAFRTLTAPTALPPVSTSHASPDPAEPAPGATPAAPDAESLPLPAAWVRDLAWGRLVEEGVAEESAAPVWDDSCAPDSFCWGAWRLELQRLSAGAETDRFGVRALGAGGLLVELVVASDAVVTTQALIHPTPEPTGRPSPSPIADEQGRTVLISLHSLPSGSVHDDMVRIWSGDLGQMGVRGADDELERAVAALRDSGRLVRVRGWHERDVADYGGARLVVEAIMDEGPLPEEPSEEGRVNGWLGTVVRLPEAASFDDYFDSRWPGGQYGIVAEDSAWAEALERLRASGEMVRVWGLLREGVDDYGEAQIVVSRIELADTIVEDD